MMSAENGSPLCRAAHAGVLDAWTKIPDGALALLFLLDQLPHNIYRGTALA